jgi:hypothetical protein
MGHVLVRTGAFAPPPAFCCSPIAGDDIGSSSLGAVRIRSVVAIGCLLMVSACGGGGATSALKYSAPAAPKPAKGAAPWPSPKNALKLAQKAGLEMARHEFLVYHIHAHLDVFVNGKAVPVPSAIGINIHDPGVRHGPVSGGTGYGGIKECAKPCISPLHTHDFTGVVHVESPTQRVYRLGQFFVEWGVKLNAKCVGGYCSPRSKFAVFVNGVRRTGDPARIAFTNLQEIAIVIGPPPDAIPRKSLLNT